MRGRRRRVSRRRGSDSTAAAPIRVGKRPVSEGRSYGCSPRFNLKRRMAGRWSSTRGAKLGAELDEDSNGGRRLGLDFGRVGHGRARGWTEELRGEVAQLGARRIEVGRRGLAGATSVDDFARFCSLELDLAQRKEEGGLGRHGKLRGVRERRRAASGAIADAWTRSPATTAAVWASGHSVEHRRGTVCSFKWF